MHTIDGGRKISNNCFFLTMIACKHTKLGCSILNRLVFSACSPDVTAKEQMSKYELSSPCLFFLHWENYSTEKTCFSNVDGVYSFTQLYRYVQKVVLLCNLILV